MSMLATHLEERYGLPSGCLEAIEYDNSLRRVAEIISGVRDEAIAEMRSEVERLTGMTVRCGMCGERGKTIAMHAPHPEWCKRLPDGRDGNWTPIPWCEDCTNNRPGA